MDSKEISVNGKIIELDDFNFVYEFTYDGKPLKTRILARNINIEDIDQAICEAISFYNESTARDNFLAIQKKFNNTEITVSI